MSLLVYAIGFLVVAAAMIFVDIKWGTEQEPAFGFDATFYVALLWPIVACLAAFAAVALLTCGAFTGIMYGFEWLYKKIVAGLRNEG